MFLTNNRHCFFFVLIVIISGANTAYFEPWKLPDACGDSHLNQSERVAGADLFRRSRLASQLTAVPRGSDFEHLTGFRRQRSECCFQFASEKVESFVFSVAAKASDGDLASVWHHKGIVFSKVKKCCRSPSCWTDLELIIKTLAIRGGAIKMSNYYFQTNNVHHYCDTVNELNLFWEKGAFIYSKKTQIVIADWLPWQRPLA